MITKVCFFSPHAYPLFNTQCSVEFGGAEVQLYLLAKELATDKKYSVHFMVADFGQGKIEEFDNVHVYKSFRLRKKFRYFYSVFAAFQLLFILKRIDADLYIQRAAGFETFIIAFFCRLFRKKFIYMTASRIECDDRLQKKGFLFSKFHLFGMKCAYLLLTQGIEDQKLLKKNFFLNSHILRNSFSLERDAGVIKKEYVLWVSSCQPLKQPEIFLELATRLPEERFVMILSPHAYHSDLYDRIIKQTEKIPNIQLVSKVPFHEIDTYYEKAKLFVNTSLYEGFPNSFIQAAKYKTPIISFGVNPDNFLEEYRCGFSCEFDFEKMVRQIRTLLENEDLRYEMSENILQYVLQHHDIKKNIRCLKHLLST